jgi:colicin import membrane protein
MKAIIRIGLVASVLALTVLGCASEADKKTTASAKPETSETTEALETTEAPKPKATTTTTTVPSETVSQENARKSAADYLEYSSFSRSGLIEQLKFEGFSETDATYGVDALNVDWNDQAAKSAADYLEYSSFSRSGLIEQLVFEGFSQAEAEYGVNATGL